MILETQKFVSQTAQERFNFLLIRRRMLVRELSLLKVYVTNMTEDFELIEIPKYSALINKITQEIDNCDENIRFTEKTFFVNRLDLENYFNCFSMDEKENNSANAREKLNEFAELRGWDKNKLIGWSEAACFAEWYKEQENNCLLI